MPRSTHRVIEASDLVDKAGLIDLDADALYGALPTAPTNGRHSRVPSREARLRDEGKEPIVIAFPHAPAKKAAVSLHDRIAFQRLLQHRGRNRSL